MTHLRILPPAILIISTLAGCTSPGKVAEETDANGKKIEYVYYTPTGSNIPVKIRKDQLQTSEAETTADQAALRKVMQMGTKQDKQPGGS